MIRLDAMQHLSSNDAAALREQVLSPAQEFSTTWSTGKLVVPAPELVNMSSDPAGARILSALATRSASGIFCITTEFLGPHPEHGVLASAAEVEGWRTSVSSFDVALILPDLSAAVIVSIDEFTLVAGDRAFVEEAVGNVDAAHKAFETYARDHAEASRHLPALAARYRDH